MCGRRTAVFISALMLAGACARAQQPSSPAPGAPVTTLHATAHLVVLDVVVNDQSGNPVKGLTQSDFSLSEDGVPQTLASFTEHDTTPGSTASSLPPDTFAVQQYAATGGGSTVILLGHLESADAPWVRKQIREYLEANAPATPIAILRRDQQGTHLVQGLTADRQVLLAAIASRRILPPPPSFVPYPGLRGGFNLVHYLTGIKGRVNLIWFASGGGGESSFPDIMRSMEDPNGTVTRVLQLSRVALYPMDATGIGAPGSGVDAPLSGAQGESFHRVYNPPTGNFGQGGGLVPGNATVGALAQASGGTSYHLHNGYKEVIAKVVDAGAHYYTISYKPSNADWNGAYRRIHLDVGVYSRPRAAWKNFLDYDPQSENRVQYRRGYVARDTPNLPAGMRNTAAATGVAGVPGSGAGSQANPNRRLISVSRGSRFAVSAPPDAMQSAMAFGTPTPMGVHFTVSMTAAPDVVKPEPGTGPPAGTFLTEAFRDSPYRTYRIHYRIDPHELTFRPIGNGALEADLQFVAVLYRDDGLEANSVTIPGHIEFDRVNYDRLMKTPLGFDQTIAVPILSNLFLRAGVHDVGSDGIGAVEIAMEEIAPAPED